MGAGSKPGERRGGRRPGSKNKATVAMEEGLAASGELPRDYMLRIMRDPKLDDSRRDAMAAKVAPYVHPTFTSVRHSGEGGGPVKIEQVRRIIVEPGHPHSKDIPPTA